MKWRIIFYRLTSTKVTIKFDIVITSVFQFNSPLFPKLLVHTRKKNLLSRHNTGEHMTLMPNKHMHEVERSCAVKGTRRINIDTWSEKYKRGRTARMLNAVIEVRNLTKNFVNASSMAGKKSLCNS